MEKKGKKDVKIPKLGGGCPPLGNFPHIIPSFSDHFPKTESFNEYLESLSGISWLPPTASFVPYTLNF